MHAAHIRQASMQGLHVLCEKPLTVLTEALHALLTTAAATKRVVFPVHNWKSAPLFQTLKQLLDADTIGRPTYVELTTLRTRPVGLNGWRLDPQIAGGGILMDHGWHALYLLLFLLGDTPHSLSANIASRRFPGAAVEDTATCDLTFPSAQAHLHLTWAASQRRNCGVIRGDKGEIRLEDSHLIIHRHGRMQQVLHLQAALSAHSYHPDWFAALLPDFFAAMAVPQAQYPDLQEAATCLRLIRLAYCSASQEGQTLSCAELL